MNYVPMQAISMLAPAKHIHASNLSMLLMQSSPMLACV
jgi:hypothetical protein